MLSAKSEGINRHFLPPRLPRKSSLQNGPRLILIKGTMGVAWFNEIMD